LRLIQSRSFYPRLTDICIDDLAARSGDIAGRILPSSAQSSITINTAHQWLQTCLGTHSSCFSDGNQADTLCSLPTRVLDVGPEDGSQDPKLHIPGSNLGQYAALSHCWGTHQTIKTTKATLLDRMQTIPFQILPKTFQDAVIVTRQLGLRYLWIDSLCIIQDCIDDWRYEAARMAAVYSNAVVTVAATAAEDTQVKGCLFLAVQLRQIRWRLDINATKIVAAEKSWEPQP